MHVLELKNIGKIYATEEAVSVGIRGVNLSFGLGEFVVITGQSGSGKTTLLNVIGGMDSFEEGELYIHGEPTSHYTREEWDRYRERWTSFIFQDYNIIESFTVLENVELALMDIPDRKERRSQAMEFLERVGLHAQANQKGSKLSGGQKQRTVIARALAQNRPIILADEPTGNLDSESACEVMRLLYKLSDDKLVLVVTHNFEDVASYATRGLRIYDGTVCEDRRIEVARSCALESGERQNEVQTIGENEEETQVAKEQQSAQTKTTKGHGWRRFADGVGLGVSIFRSRPSVSVFLCLLMIVAALGIFLFTGALGKMVRATLYEDPYLFQPKDGRLVVVKKDGSVIREEELQALGARYGARKVLSNDVLCDAGDLLSWEKFVADPEWRLADVNDLPFGITSEQDYGEPSIGRYPQSPSECLLYLPYSLQDCYGRDTLLIENIRQNGLTYAIVGVKYYTDNHQIGQVVLTEEGYRINSALAAVGTSLAGTLTQVLEDGQTLSGGSMAPVQYSFALEPGKVYVRPDTLVAVEKELVKGYRVNIVRSEEPLDWTGEIYKDVRAFTSISENVICEYDGESNFSVAIVMNPYTLLDVMERYEAEHNTQSSLFFENNAAMESVAEQVGTTEYLALPSSTKYVSSESSFSEQMPRGVMLALLWVAMLVFFGVFVCVCARSAMDAFAKDVAIMRSMGVDAGVIRVGVYVRMLLVAIPAVVVIPTVASVVYRTTAGNRALLYLYPVHYVLLFVGLLLLTIVVVHRQLRYIFETVARQALRGGHQ